MKSTKTDLGMAGAVWNALLGRSISHFPQASDGTGRLIEHEILAQIESALQIKASQDKENEEFLAEHCRETLDEVKQLTEYQDQKATRLLTIVAFLSALSGVLFSRLSDLYPLWATLSNTAVSLQTAILLGAYLSFACFVILAISGALVIFHATRTTFKYPKPAGSDGVNNKLSSVLFYEGILRSTPTEWAKTFTSTEDAQNNWAANVRTRYVKAYISESYLVASKVADKLRYLQPGQKLLLTAIKLLLLFTVLFTLVIACIPSTANNSANKMNPVRPIEGVPPPQVGLPNGQGAIPSAGSQKVVEPLQLPPEARHQKAIKRSKLANGSALDDSTSNSKVKLTTKGAASK